MGFLDEETPLVSVVIPCYNHAKYVQQSIQSVIDQDYENIELIIIDDGSKDKSVEAIKEMIPACVERFARFEFRCRPNKGLCKTLNEALEWCEGEFFAPLASDDIILKSKTAVQVAYLQSNHNCVGVFGGAKVLKENGDVSVERPSVANRFYFKDVILNKLAIFTGSQLLRMSSIRSAGGYSPNLVLEDFYINLKITENGSTLDTIPGVFVCYRRHENNITNNSSLMNEERRKIIELYRHNMLYRSAVIEFNYNKSLALVSYSKAESFTVFIRSVFMDPSVIFRLNTLKLLVKMFVPKTILQNKRKGR